MTTLSGPAAWPTPRRSWRRGRHMPMGYTLLARQKSIPLGSVSAFWHVPSETGTLMGYFLSYQLFIVSAAIEKTENVDRPLLLHRMIDQDIVADDDLSISQVSEPWVPAGLIQHGKVSQLPIAGFHLVQQADSRCWVGEAMDNYSPVPRPSHCGPPQ